MRKTILIIAVITLATQFAQAQICYNNNIVEGKCSSALGFENVSNGITSFATGNLNVAEGDFSFASGNNVKTEGKYSIGLGWNLTIDGLASFALGYGNSATGNTSCVLGSLSTATGTASMAFGNKIDAITPFSFVIGKGISEHHLVNNISSSLMIGFESDIPTIFVGSGYGPGTLGKVGIGTTTPGSLLQVDGNLAIGYSEETTAPENGLCINGKLGVGTSIPGSQLQLTDNMAIGYSRSTAAPSDGLCVRGNVGIGITNPTEKLHINGSVKLNSIKLPDGTEIAGKEDLGKWQSCETGIQYNEGKVSIGNSNPNRPLTIDGSGNTNELISLNDLNGSNKWHLNLKSNGLNFAETGVRDYRLYLQEGGKMGVNCGNPKAMLQVGDDYTNVSVGPSPGETLGWGSYIGFNAARDPKTGIWQSYNNGTFNGGAVIYASIQGGLQFAMLSSTGPGNSTYSDADIKNNVKLRITRAGTMKVKEVEVIAEIWSDCVFEEDYKLRTLNEVEDYIKLNGCLPEIPSEKEVKAEGLNLGEMDALLLKKLEELTLYTIEQHKQLQQQQQLIQNLQNQIGELKK